MIELQIPGGERLVLEHLLLDFNGTLAFDGRLMEGVTEDLHRLALELTVHVITADTFGDARRQLEGERVELTIISGPDQGQAKLDYLRALGGGGTVAVGNGRNDGLMLEHAALGVALIQGEGAYVQTVLSADVVCTDIRDALGLLLNPKRLIATLRI